MAEETIVTNAHAVLCTGTSPRAREAQLASDVGKCCALLAHLMMRRPSKEARKV